MFDPEGKGTIKKEYLGEVLTTRADRFNEEELASIMDAAPIDAEGNLDYKGKNNFVFTEAYGFEDVRVSI